MKHLWTVVLIGILALIYFTNVFFLDKSGLAPLISFRGLESPHLIKEGGHQALIVKIYSSYPFNHRGLLTINAGQKDSVKVGMPVVVNGLTFLGKVIEVKERESVVQTIFDRNFSLSVKIGNGVDSLLAGGQEPKLTLIDKKREIKEGDPVYTAAAGLPYGLKVGLVSSISDVAVTSFKETSLNLDYQPNELVEAAILPDYVGR